ncbi:MAG: hypothetical protein E7773_04910 [Sphingomonas sp.]|uniref:hypothetical protein n=1 Tax=Sphingomonas sp. TaxID=28214 RepID=UPI0011F86394|nr:hypothetical protein [Sphingomonas sp.]THD37365.1 MAG: hypothetical protein E7773_04910 [Sphingomonas sp.]
MLRIGTTMGLLALASLLVACDGSGSGGGGATGTPTPTPGTPTPTPANTALSNLTFDGDLPNIAGRSVETFAAGSSISSSVTSDFTTLSLHYTASTQGYTLTDGSDTATFLPGDVDSAHSYPGIVVYAKNSGTGLTDTLSRLRPGTATSVPTYYVGGGAWQRVQTVAGAGPTTTADAFNYGFPTATTAVPITGTRRYAVDALAFDPFKLNINPVGSGMMRIIGEGAISVDFGAKTVSIQFVPHSPTDTEATTSIAPPTYTATGTLAADGSFAGDFDCGGCSTPAHLSGKLYGPAAEEIALTYAKGTTGPRATGVLIGHMRGLFDHDVTDTDFSNAQTSLSAGASYQPGQFNYDIRDGAALTTGNRYSTATALYYLSTNISTRTGLYRENPFSFASLISAETTSQANVYGYSLAATANADATDQRLYLYNSTALDPILTLHSVQLGRFERRAVATAQRTNIFFASGMASPAGVVPATGTGRYQGQMLGQYVPVEGGGGAAAELTTGAVDLTINFATRAVIGTVQFIGATNHGTFTLTGTMAADGTITGSLAPPATPTFVHSSGSFSARLYGTAAGELGASFRLRSCRQCVDPGTNYYDAYYGASVAIRTS